MPFRERLYFQHMSHCDSDRKSEFLEMECGKVSLVVLDSVQALPHLARYSTEVRRGHGLEVQIRVGLNSGEVVVRAIGNDLHMDYSAIGQTTHLAARME
jgi:class 3 adenylate cyclase